MKKDKRLIYFIIGFITALLITAIGCEKKDKFGQPDSNDILKTDTVYVDRIVEVPKKSGSFKDSLPEPKIVYKADPVLLEKYNQLETEKQKLEAYISAITKRTYQKMYISSDSIVKIEVKDSVTGTLDYQSVTFDIAPQKVKIKEKVVTNTIEKYPDLTISLGAGMKLPTSFNDPMSFEGVIGVKGKKGYNWQLGVDTRKEVRLTLTKDLFTKF